MVIDATLDKDLANPPDGVVENPPSRPTPVGTEESVNESN